MESGPTMYSHVDRGSTLVLSREITTLHAVLCAVLTSNEYADFFPLKLASRPFGPEGSLCPIQ